MMRKTFLTSALDMPEIMSYIYNKSWKLQFSASSSIIIIEDFYLQTFLHSLHIGDGISYMVKLFEICGYKIIDKLTISFTFYLWHQVFHDISFVFSGWVLDTKFR